MNRERAGGPRIPAQYIAVPRQAESTEEKLWKLRKSSTSRGEVEQA